MFSQITPCWRTETLPITMTDTQFGQIRELLTTQDCLKKNENADKKRMLRMCILGNLTTLIGVVVLIFIYNDDNKFMRFGPNNNLTIISVKIDTWLKYSVVLFCIALIDVVQVVSEDIAGPILGFTVFNPDLTHVKGWDRIELQFYANSMFTIGSLRRAFMIFISIGQVDISLFNVLVQEATTCYTVRLLLNKKTFENETQFVAPTSLSTYPDGHRTIKMTLAIFNEDGSIEYITEDSEQFISPEQSVSSAQSVSDYSPGDTQLSDSVNYDLYCGFLEKDKRENYKKLDSVELDELNEL